TYGSDIISSPEFLDLNLDGQRGADTTTLVGVGVCEDKVPCHALLSTCCGFELNANTCRGFLENYWKSTGLDDQDISELVITQVQVGTCTMPSGTISWFEQGGFDEI